jgi:hypothetical protein
MSSGGALCRSVRILPVNPYTQIKSGSIFTLLQYPMTLREGPKYPVLPTLMGCALNKRSVDKQSVNYTPCK